MLSASGPRSQAATMEVRLFAPPTPGAPYPLELTSPANTLTGQAQFDQSALDEARLDPALYGQRLGAMLFADDAIGTGFREALAWSAGRDTELHLRLRLDPPELQALSWERLALRQGNAWQQLAIDAETPLSRFVPQQAWREMQRITARPLKLLVLIASPSNLADYRLDAVTMAERDALKAIWQPIPDVQVTYLESGTPTPPTLQQLQQALNGGYHLVHFLCHGARTDGGSVLYLEGDDGTVAPVTADIIVERFAQAANPPVFCFFAACESAVRARTDAFVPLGPQLVAGGGVPAVIAMADRVGVATAQRFASQFYAQLFRHGIVDMAANEARALVQEAWDWSVPVLFSRADNQQLLDFPISERYDPILVHTGEAFESVRQVAQRQHFGTELTTELEALVAELSKSHRVLIERTTKFREIGDDPATFAANFRAFFPEFKGYYDSQDWTQEDTSCSEIMRLSARILPQLSPVVEPAIFAQLQQELALLSDADGGLLQGLREFLDAMDGAVEQIDALLRASDLPGAIAAKDTFEGQISPTAKRSKELLGRMSKGIGRMVAA